MAGLRQLLPDIVFQIISFHNILWFCIWIFDFLQKNFDFFKLFLPGPLQSEKSGIYSSDIWIKKSFLKELLE